MAADQSASRLLSLPSELRNAIYELLLIQDSRSAPADERQRSSSSGGGGHCICANVLRTCRQVHAEAAPILYGENMFVAHSNLLTALPSFLLCKVPNAKGTTTLPPVTSLRVASMIRKFFFRVRLDIDSRFTARQASDCFTGLDVLEIEVFQPSYGTCDFTVLKLLEGVRGVGKASVAGSVGDGHYARWLEAAMMSDVGVNLPDYEKERVDGDEVSYWDLDG